MAYTTINKSTNYFSTKLYTGDGNSTKAITGVGFQPDWILLRPRGDNHAIRSFDAVRGSNKVLQTNGNNVETTNDQYGWLGSLDSDGFTTQTGTDSNQYNVNKSSSTYVAWNWKAGGGQGSSNTDGSINTTYTSVNTTAGFSISTYTGTGSAGTIGHGLGSTPKTIIVKCTSNADTWAVYHADIGATKYMELDTTAAAQTSTQPWNDTAPTSSVFTVGNWSATNGSGRTYVAYCFAEKTGFSKFGSYVANDQDGSNSPFVYTGFKPKFLLIKNIVDSSASSDWVIADNKRPGYNIVNKKLFANESQSESSDEIANFLSNGFKLDNSTTDLNYSTRTYIYWAFGQSLVGSNNVPCTGF